MITPAHRSSQGRFGESYVKQMLTKQLGFSRLPITFTKYHAPYDLDWGGTRLQVKTYIKTNFYRISKKERTKIMSENQFDLLVLVCPSWYDDSELSSYCSDHGLGFLKYPCDSLMSFVDEIIPLIVLFYHKLGKDEVDNNVLFYANLIVNLVEPWKFCSEGTTPFVVPSWEY